MAAKLIGLQSKAALFAFERVARDERFSLVTEVRFENEADTAKDHV